ncbi:MAG: hypothetical protein M3M94_01225, partial [Actinomycetota bacterium]|nr:hypothetical protein [Actinomycetota bacterium]
MDVLRFVYVATLALAAAGSAAAGTGLLIERAAAELAQDPVYVHPRAEAAIPTAQAEELRRRITATDAGPLYIA